MSNYRKAAIAANKSKSNKLRSRRASVTLIVSFIQPSQAQLDNISAVLFSLISVAPRKQAQFSQVSIDDGCFSDCQEVNS